MSVDTRRTRLGLALALIFATLIASTSTALTAAPGQAAVPIPRPRPPAAYSLPHPQPQIPRPPRDLFPEVYPSNDPNVYEPTGIDRFGAGATSDVLGSAYDDDDDGGGNTGIGAYSGGTSDYLDDDNNGGGLNLGSVGVAGGVVMSLGSLLMWLRRRR
jgi:hypothetical protein